jgi:transcriptional regulator with XRE-family HTH domain
LQTLKHIRRERGMSQGDLAEAAGLSRQVVSNLERGSSHGYPVTWKRLADALQVTVDDLLEDFYAPKDSSLLSAERALRLTREVFTAEIKGAETEQLHKLLAELMGDDIARTHKELKAGRGRALPGEVFSRALEVRAELIERGEKPPENRLPIFKRRLEALHLG